MIQQKKFALVKKSVYFIETLISAAGGTYE